MFTIEKTLSCSYERLGEEVSDLHFLRAIRGRGLWLFCHVPSLRTQTWITWHHGSYSHLQWTNQQWGKIEWVSEEWVKSLSHVQLFATPWPIAYQVPLSMEFFRREYWSGLPFPLNPTQYLSHCRPWGCPPPAWGTQEVDLPQPA